MGLSAISTPIGQHPRGAGMELWAEGRRGDRDEGRGKLLIYQSDGGGNLGRLFTIEWAEADKSSHVHPSGETPTRLSWCGYVAAAGEKGQPIDPRRCDPMSIRGVRRDKAALSGRCKSHSANAPAGSNRSRHRGN